MKRILVSSFLISLVGCVNYKDTFTQNLNNTGAYVANSASNTISQYSVDSSTYALKDLGTVATGTTPVFVAMHPNSKFVYAVNNGSSDISVYSISTSTRKLTLASTTAQSSPDLAPVSIIFDSAGTYAYVAGTDLTNTSITSYIVTSSTGALTKLGTVTASSNSTCANVVDMAIVGSNLYLACNSNPSIQSYQITASTGSLTYNTVLATGGTNITYMTPSPSGAHLFGSETGGSVGAVSIDSAGTMTAAASITAGTNPVGVYFNSGGTLAWIVNKGSNNIMSYTVSGSTLTPSVTSTVGTSPTAMAFAGSYAYAYVVNSGDNTVSLYSVNSSTGALTLSSTIGTGTTPTNLVGY